MRGKAHDIEAKRKADKDIENIEHLLGTEEAQKKQHIAQHREAVGRKADKKRAEAATTMAHSTATIARLKRVNLMQEEHTNKGVGTLVRGGLQPLLIAGKDAYLADKEVGSSAAKEPRVVPYIRHEEPYRRYKLGEGEGEEQQHQGVVEVSHSGRHRFLQCCAPTEVARNRCPTGASAVVM